MKIAIFGGSGFVGNYIIEQLLKLGYLVNVLVREGNESKLKNYDKCNIFSGEIKDIDVVDNIIKNSEAIIYNIGIIREFKKDCITYNDLHYQGSKLTIDIAKKYNINRFILMSANGVIPNGTGYQKTKYLSECYLKKNIRDWTIIRPSLIFGNPRGGIEFCTQLKKDMLSLPFPAPSFFKGINFFKSGQFRMSPIHVKNVAEIFSACIENNHSFKKIYHLGNKNLTWNEIIKIVSSSYSKNKYLIPVPAFPVMVAAFLFDRYQWFPVSRDQIKMLLDSNVCKSTDVFKRYNIDPINFNKESLGYLNEE